MEKVIYILMEQEAKYALHASTCKIDFMKKSFEDAVVQIKEAINILQMNIPPIKRPICGVRYEKFYIDTNGEKRCSYCARRVEKLE